MGLGVGGVLEWSLEGWWLSEAEGGQDPQGAPGPGPSTLVGCRAKGAAEQAPGIGSLLSQGLCRVGGWRRVGLGRSGKIQWEGGQQDGSVPFLAWPRQGSDPDLE